jgi:hypothetical protein
MGLPPADLALSELDGSTNTGAAGAAERESTRDIVVKYVLRNSAIWSLAFSYFFLYIVRQGMTSWGQFYIVDQKGVSSAAQAAATMSGLEIGGFFGGLCSGVLSDACNGFRMRVVVLYMVGLAVALAGLAMAPSGDTRHLIAWLSAIGFFIYGPQMLIGLIGSEVSHPRVRARAPFAAVGSCGLWSLVWSRGLNEGCESRAQHTGSCLWLGAGGGHRERSAWMDCVHRSGLRRRAGGARGEEPGLGRVVLAHVGLVCRARAAAGALLVCAQV